MNYTVVLAAILATALNLTTSNAFVGRPVLKLPHLSRNKGCSPHLPVKDSSIHKLWEMESRTRVRGGPSRLKMSVEASPLLTSLVPKVGIVTSALLLFSPMTAVRKASKDEALGDLNPIPLTLMAFGSFWWLAYGLSISDPNVIMANAPGCIASIWYAAALLPLQKGSQLKTSQSIVVGLSAVTITVWSYLSLANKSIAQVSSILGTLAVTLGVVLFGSPLSTIKTVLSTKDAGSILGSLTIAQCFNTALWVAYGLAIRDGFVYGPNVAGLGFGIIQLMLKVLFPSK